MYVVRVSYVIALNTWTACFTKDSILRRAIQYTLISPFAVNICFCLVKSSLFFIIQRKFKQAVFAFRHAMRKNLSTRTDVKV